LNPIRHCERSVAIHDRFVFCNDDLDNLNRNPKRELSPKRPAL